MTGASEGRLQSAREYIASGLSLVPIAAGEKKPVSDWRAYQLTRPADGEAYPTWKIYQLRRPTDEEIDRWVRDYFGLGVVGGKVSGNSNGDGQAKDALEILDIEAIAPLDMFRTLVEKVAPGLLARLPRVKTPTGGRHLYYRCEIVEGNQKLAERAEEMAEESLPRKDDGSLDEEAIKKLGLRLIEGKYFKIRTLIETRGEGGQVLSPLCLPGTHPSGGVYELINGDLRAIPTVTAEERDILLQCARACNEFIDPKDAKGKREAGREKVEGLKPGEDYNTRPDACEKSRLLLDELGWTKFGEGKRGELWSRPGVDDHCSATLFPDGSLYVFSSNASPFDANQSYSPFGVYTEGKHGGDYSAAAKALAKEGYGDRRKDPKEAKAPSSEAEDWPDPQPIPDGLLPVRDLPVELIPRGFRAWLADIAERMQVPVSFLAVAAIVCFAAVIGNRIRIRPKRHDDWTVVPNLWGAIVGRPGVMKSPAIAEVLRFLYRLQAKATERYVEALKEWRFKKEAAEVKQAALRDKMKKAAKDGKPLDRFRDEFEDAAVPDQPKETRYIVNDVTVEKLGELLAENPLGLQLFRDELSGWLRSLDDERRKNDRAFFLEAWNGDSSYTYHRIERGKIEIPYATVSILGGIQPGPLEVYLRGALGYGEGDDGLLQRLQMSVYPDISNKWVNVDREPDTDARDEAFEVFCGAVSLAPAEVGGQFETVGGGASDQDKQIAYLHFTDEAQAFFDGWYTELNRELRSGTFEHPALEAHFSKYRSLMPTLALLFHLCDCIAEDAAGSVSLESAQMAAAWCTVLTEHAQRIYGLGIRGAVIHAKTLARRIQKDDLIDGFTAREIYSTKGWAGLTTAKSVEQALDILESLNWVLSYEVKTGGRPKTQYAINPKAKEVAL